MKSAFVLILVSASLSAQDSAPTPQSACGPMNAKFEINIDNRQSPPNVKAEAGKALVYVIEEQLRGVKEITVRVGLDGSWVGATRGDSYISFRVEPGQHHLCADIMPGVRSASIGRVSLFGFTAEAGSVYYFRARTTGGAPTSTWGNELGDPISISLDLDLVNRDEGKYLVTFSPLSVSNARPVGSGKDK